MLNSLVKKIFISIVGLFLIIVLLQLGFQKFFMKDMYDFLKKKKIEKSFEQFCDLASESQLDVPKLNELTFKFREESDALVVLADDKMQILNSGFLESFNSITLDVNGSHYTVLVDYLINDKGQIYEYFNKFDIGDTLSVKATLINGTAFWEPIEIEIKDVWYENDYRTYDWDDEFLDPNDIQGFEGTIVTKNFIDRRKATSSYYQDKLLWELRYYWIDTKKDPDYAETYFKNGYYEYVEDYSGQRVAVFSRKWTHDNGSEMVAFSLYTYDNVNDAFKILNQFYYYIFAFQFILILVLVYGYSKWITKPLFRLIDSAKSISKLDFSQRTSIETNDELSVLSDSLNEIAENLSLAIEELESSNNQLAIEAIKKSENEERMRNLLTHLSHEFKTPLGIISGFIEIIKDGFYEKEPDYYTSTMAHEVEKLNDLVMETIELSKLETGSYKLKLDTFESSDFIREIIDRFENQISEKELSVIIDLEKSVVLGDKLKIEQVLVNLLSNGIQYSPENQRLEIRTQKKNEQLEILVKNHGVTIEENDIQHIWDRFYRAEKSRNRSLGGSGLGLTIVKNILELHHSKYGICNEGNAVIFSFTLDIK